MQWWRRRVSLLLVATGFLVTGCSDDSPSIESDRDMIDALERAGISCPEWDTYRGRGDQHDTNTCSDSTAGFVGFRQEASAAEAALSTAVGQENARCIRRMWSLNGGDPTAQEVTTNLLWGSWGVWGSSDAIEGLHDEIGGEIFTADDPPPDGVSESDFRPYAETSECAPIPPLAGSSESPPVEPTSPPPPSTTDVNGLALGDGIWAGMIDCGGPASSDCSQRAVATACAVPATSELTVTKGALPELEDVLYTSHDGEDLVASVSRYGQFVSVETCAVRPGTLQIEALHSSVRKEVTGPGLTAKTVMCASDSAPGEGLPSYPIPVLSEGETLHCLVWDAEDYYRGQVLLAATAQNPYYRLVRAEITSAAGR